MPPDRAGGCAATMLTFTLMLAWAGAHHRTLAGGDLLDEAAVLELFHDRGVDALRGVHALRGRRLLGHLVDNRLKGIGTGSRGIREQRQVGVVAAVDELRI